MDSGTLALWVTAFIPVAGGTYTFVRKQIGQRKAKLKALESKIESLQSQIDTLKSTVEKDITYLKESYNEKLSYLSQKIDELRNEINNQNKQIMELLLRMINKD